MGHPALCLRLHHLGVAYDAVANDPYLQDLLRKTIRACLLRPRSPKSKLEPMELSGRAGRERIFREWYQHYGNRYLFLFKKNLGVTNIQFAELLALIRVHLRDTKPSGRGTSDRTENGQSRRREVQFISSPDFHLFAEKLFQPFLRVRGGSKALSAALDNVVAQYG
jgi:hypothetical protein